LKVSVIITNYNNEKLVGRAIRSAMHQDGIKREDYEILVVDDGSTDNSVFAIQQFDGSVLPIALKHNGGLSAAINKGILNSAGMFIARLDSDDYYRPLFLAIMSEFLEQNKQYAWVRCDYLIKDKDEITMGRSDKELACCYMFRRHALEAVGLYDEKLRTGETENIMVKLLQDPAYRGRGGYINIPLYNWYKREGSLTNAGERGQI